MSHSFDRYHIIQEQILEKTLQCGRDSSEIKLVVVSKMHPISSIQRVYEAGCRDFGESRLQEALQKIPGLSPDIQWHWVGTLQKNKVNKVISCFSCIHSVDSLALAKNISEASQKLGHSPSILLQVNTSGEASKHGLTPIEWESRLEEINQLPSIRLEGLMTIAPLTDNHSIIRQNFRQLRQLRDKWQTQIKSPSNLHHLSMGMSNDFLIAIEEGATLLRIGSAILGKRSESTN
jgi:pyridoxal phosphate enzyme (YggS family)